MMFRRLKVRGAGTQKNRCPRCGMEYQRKDIPQRAGLRPLSEKGRLLKLPLAEAGRELAKMPWRCRCGAMLREARFTLDWAGQAVIVLVAGGTVLLLSAFPRLALVWGVAVVIVTAALARLVAARPTTTPWIEEVNEHEDGITTKNTG